MNPGRVLLAVNDFPPILGGESRLYHALARHLPPGDTLVLAPRVRYLVCGQLLSLGGPTRLLSGLFGLRYAVFVHGADLKDYSDRFPWSRLARWVIEGADTVLVNSRFTGRLVERLTPGAARRIDVLPMGVDPAPVLDTVKVEELRRRYRLGDGPVLLSVSRLVPMKGHDIVIAALPDLVARVPGLRYLVVGAGPHRAALQHLAEAVGVGRHVVFAGRVTDEDLPPHYGLATLFVQLSRDPGREDGLEGFGLSFLEAASHGIPCIAGRSGGVPEAVCEGETGWLIPPEDRAAFVGAAARLLSDPDERSRMSIEAIRWAGRHSWQRTADHLQALVKGN